MVQYCVLNIENQNAINAKAKDKKDGVYTFRGVAYRVRNARVTHFACRGEVIQQYGHFNTVVGSYVDRYSTDSVAALKGFKE